MNNHEVARILYNISVILDVKGEDRFKAVAYRRASRFVDSMEQDINTVEDLDALPTIGEGIEKKIKDMLKTGKSSYYEKLKKSLPINFEDLISIPGVGPKTIAKLYKKLGIKNRKELLEAAKNKKIRKIEGLGSVIEQNIKENIGFQKKSSSRRLLIEGVQASEEIINELKMSKLVENVSVAGSVRRMKDTIGDIDIICTSNHADKLMDYFTNMLTVKKVIAEGETKSSIKLYNNLQVDLRVVKPDEYGSALQHFTGSKDHNIVLRKLAIKKGLKINEYGTFKGEKRVVGQTEESVYKALNMQYIPPELRENKGEIELALKNKIPKLVELKNIQGEFHVHSKWSDGLNSIKEIADYCRKKMKYSFIGIADHTGSLQIANALNIRNIKKRTVEIRELNKAYKDFKVLNCAEANIKTSGRLDLPDDVLSKFDFVIASIHHGFTLSKQEMTERLLKVLDNPYVKALGHPTGRKLLRRQGYEYDYEKIFRKAAEKNIFLEIDSFPDRMDLNDELSRLAKDCGVKFIISTDAHSLAHLDYIQYGVGVARRAGLTKKDVFNTKRF
ncbi:MAG: DNA polymerase/3'-5' exonuclease PolX [Nanoarchaeota archaeon]|nr:DNA polymerase/3'-5' exonuclease PolX [Nanoarchaeota archaeon]